MTPDAAFLDFFNGAFRRRLEAIQIPGLPVASWDRKAAYLLWQAEHAPASPSDLPINKPDEVDIFA